LVSPDVNLGQFRLDISQNLANLGDWLNRVYLPLRPLLIPTVELTPPTPTHVRVEINNAWSRDIAIADVMSPIEGITYAVTNGMAVKLRFIRQESTELQLAVATLNTKG
jgi:hypothetical protein